MTRFTSATQFAHDAPARTAVLVVQLGTPTAPEPGPVRRYLAQFLADPRVVEIPPVLWKLILHGIILRTRPAKSALKYASIWTKDGSPLMVNTRRQARLLRGYLGEAGQDVEVEFAMRYGEPSIGTVLRKLREKRLERLLVLPMYPQYAASTTATAFDEVYRELMTWRNPPELRTIKHFHDRPDYIDALAASIRKQWVNDGPPDQLVMSFHGLPKRSLMLGDPYHCECLVTGRLLAHKLGLRDGSFRVTFQSRFGRAQWLTPYTGATLTELGQAGTRRVDVVCPGFVADCLETLEEIAIEGKHTFIAAGGKEFRYIPCLNDAPDFVHGLTGLVSQHLAGWPTQRPAAEQLPVAARQRADTLARARAAGAQS